MYKLYVKDGYKSVLSLRETQRAISFIKETFQKKFAKALGLERISAPLFVTKASGLNDDLNGVERKVEFDLKECEDRCQIVQSLAKWKRYALYKYGFKVGEGIYTDMNAVRRDDNMDNTHSVYVDQWDWEKIITAKDRTIEFLKETVTKIVGAIAETHAAVVKAFPALSQKTEKEVHFITTQDLEDAYPALSPKEREDAVTKKYKTVFVMQIGSVLNSGIKHDGRAPDYDDWALNGDLLVWDETLGSALELSSMGIRVDENSLVSQLEIADCKERLNLDYHKKIMDKTLPLTIGGGIGQSRLCLYLLKKLHIGEVYSSGWPEEMMQK
ncbi:MAG: aspartate--ammonia ligase [Clostridia bacterium]|nr:aspartate--ammonia ligase [Clostridia bacterium]